MTDKIKYLPSGDRFGTYRIRLLGKSRFGDNVGFGMRLQPDATPDDLKTMIEEAAAGFHAVDWTITRVKASNWFRNESDAETAADVGGVRHKELTLDDIVRLLLEGIAANEAVIAGKRAKRDMIEAL